MSQKDDIKGKNYKISRIGQKLKTYFVTCEMYCAKLKYRVFFYSF